MRSYLKVLFVLYMINPCIITACSPDRGLEQVEIIFDSLSSLNFRIESTARMRFSEENLLQQEKLIESLDSLNVSIENIILSLDKNEFRDIIDDNSIVGLNAVPMGKGLYMMQWENQDGSVVPKTYSIIACNIDSINVIGNSEEYVFLRNIGYVNTICSGGEDSSYFINSTGKYNMSKLCDKVVALRIKNNVLSQGFFEKDGETLDVIIKIYVPGYEDKIKPVVIVDKKHIGFEGELQADELYKVIWQ